MKKVSDSVSTPRTAVNRHTSTYSKRTGKRNGGSTPSAKPTAAGSTRRSGRKFARSSRAVARSFSRNGPISFREEPPEVVAVALEVRGDYLNLQLADGRRVSTPLEFYPSLLGATPRQRRDWQFLGGGTGVEWEELDLQLSVDSIVAGRREHIPPPGFRERLAADLAALGLKAN